MKIDFLNDLKNIIISNLEFMGFSLPKNKELAHLMLCYKNIGNKHIVHRKRRISFSKEISINEDLKLFTDVINKVKNGDDINCFLSKRIRCLEYQDKLLNDWGIHHLHYQRKRADQLLFVMLSDDHAYFIDIMPHENYKKRPNEVTWTNSRLIQIVHSNWPDLLTFYKINGVDKDTITDQERRTLRQLNCNSTITTSDGTTYWGIGEGLTSTGHSIKHLREVDYQIKCVKNMEQDFLQKYQEKLIKENVESSHMESIEMHQNKEIRATIKVISPNKNQKIFIDSDIKSNITSYVLVNC